MILILPIVKTSNIVRRNTSLTSLVHYLKSIDSKPKTFPLYLQKGLLIQLAPHLRLYPSSAGSQCCWYFMWILYHCFLICSANPHKWDTIECYVSFILSTTSPLMWLCLSSITISSPTLLQPHWTNKVLVSKP